MTDDLLSDIDMLKANIIRNLKQRESLGDYNDSAAFLRELLGMFLILTGLVENVVRMDARSQRASTSQVVEPEDAMASAGTPDRVTADETQVKRRRSPAKH